MGSILTNELCRRVSWTGIKNSIMFGSSNMVGLIIGKFCIICKSFANLQIVDTPINLRILFQT